MNKRYTEYSLSSCHTTAFFLYIDDAYIDETIEIHYVQIQYVADVCLRCTWYIYIFAFLWGFR